MYMDFPGKIIGVGCQFLHQGILWTQGLNPSLLHCRWIIYHLSHQRSSIYTLLLLLLLSRFSRVRLFVTPWTIVCQVPLSIEFSRQEYWSGLLFPSPGDLLDPGIECMSPAL